MGVVFLLDASIPHGFAVPILYALPSTFATYALRGRPVGRVFGLLAAALIALGFWLSPGHELAESLVNRGLALIVVWGSLYFASLLLKIQALQLDAQARFSSTFEAVPVGLVMADASGRILLANHQLEEMFGYGTGELAGRSVDSLVPEGLSRIHREHRRRYLEDPTPREMGADRDLRARRSDGTEFAVGVGLKPVEVPGGSVVLASVLDITDRKRQQARLERLNQELERSNLELAQFAYVASHDLKTPLNHIGMHTQILTELVGEGASESARRSAGFVTAGVRRMRALIDDLLSYSRVAERSVVQETVDVEALVAELVETLDPDLRATSGRVRVDPLPAVHGNRMQIERLFQNLLANALKFRAPARPPEIHVAAVVEGTRVWFSVRDNGIGFDMRHADRIFEVFKRLETPTSVEGTGIGLAVARKVVELHGGTIAARSRPGEGAEFTFTLPLASAKDPEVDAP